MANQAPTQEQVKEHFENVLKNANLELYNASFESLIDTETKHPTSGEYMQTDTEVLFRIFEQGYLLGYQSNLPEFEG